MNTAPEMLLSKRQYKKYLRLKNYAVLEEKNGKICVMPPERVIRIHTSSGFQTVKTRTWLLS